MMKKQLQKQLCIFAAFAAAFLAAGSIWYWQTGGTLALTVLMFTPAVSVLLTTLLAGAGWKELLANFHLKPRLRQNKGRYLGVWLLTPVVAYLGAAFYFLLFPQQFTLQSALAVESGMQGTDYIAFLATMIPLAVLVNPLMGLPQCLGEELAWRGWLLPKLTERFGQLRAVLLTGLVWGIWHAPVVAMGYNYGEGHPLANVAAMVLFCLVLGVIQGFLFWRTDSIWGPVLFHAAVNGIDLWKPTDLFMNSPANLFVGPNLVGIVGGLGFVLLAIWCLRQIGRGKVSA